MYVYITRDFIVPNFSGALEPMAEKKGVNKSEEIRKAAKAMQDKGEKPRPVVIIAALKKQGIAVSSPQVSMVLKRMGLRQSQGRKAAAAGGRSGALSVEDLLAAKKLVSQFGNTARAMAALEALQKFET
jgi:ribosomal protein L11